jgi:DNA-binding NarL/FixJ family response regulator
MSETLRVVIAEDNYLVREGVRRLLEDSGQIEVVACVGDAVELLDAVRRLSPSAVLTDIRMPPSHHMEGIEAARAIRTEDPEIGVVVLSQHTDESYARALFNDGSAGLGYLLKDRVGDLEDLVRALQEVASGGSVVDPLIIDTLVARQQTRASSPLSSRTPRELDVLPRDGPGQDQCRHLASPVSFRVDSGEARQRDLHQARHLGRARPPQGRRRNRVPRERGSRFD